MAIRFPDLNPTDNILGILVRKVYCSGKQYANVATLKSAVITFWGILAETVLFGLVMSMQKRCIAVPQNRGHCIGY